MPGKGIQTRINIIEKSLQLFSVKGFYNTSVNDILTATNLTKGGLYGHFRSKEDIWYAVYDQAVSIWRKIAFNGVKESNDPIERIQRTIKNDLLEYLGKDIFEGGCFFLNMLVELSGQSASMIRHILKGYIGFSRLFRIWLEEAEEKNLLRPQLNLKETANFIVISLNGASALYSSTREPDILNQTATQLKLYVDSLRK